AQSGRIALTAESISTLWPEVVRTVGGMLGGDLSKARLPAIFGPNQLVVPFSAEYNQQYHNCADANRLYRIQEAIRQLTGERWIVRIEQMVPAGHSTFGGEPSLAVRNQPDVDPLIQAVQSSFDARLLKIDDGFGRSAATLDNKEPDLRPNESEDE